MAEQMFDGFDHTTYQDEVASRWGEQASVDSDRWWRGMSAAERADWQASVARLCADWAAAADLGIDPAGDEAQVLAQRQFDWLSGIPGTPGARGFGAPGASGPTKEYFTGLAEMYVADPRFAANYGGRAGAEFVRDAMRAYADREL